jgi:hypothetical protein
MTQGDQMKRINNYLSQKILGLFEKLEDKKIAKALGTTPAFLKRVRNGHACLTERHVEAASDYLQRDVYSEVLPEIIEQAVKGVAVKAKNLAVTGTQSAADLAGEGVDFVNVRIARPVAKFLCKWLTGHKD